MCIRDSDTGIRAGGTRSKSTDAVENGAETTFWWDPQTELKDMQIKDHLFSDIRPEVPKYRRHTLQKQPLCSMHLANKLQQLNYERRRNPLAVDLNFLPLARESCAVRPK